jgi:hypothetical protein
VLRVEGLASSPLVGRVIGHLREWARTRSRSRRRQGRLQVKAPGQGRGKGCQVDEGVRARGFLRLNMGTRTTPRHERALTDAAPESHVWAAVRAGGRRGWRRRWERASTTRREVIGDSGGRCVGLGRLLISRGVRRGRGVAVVVVGKGTSARRGQRKHVEAGARTPGEGSRRRSRASSMEAETQSAEPNAMPEE